MVQTCPQFRHAEGTLERTQTYGINLLHYDVHMQANADHAEGPRAALPQLGCRSIPEDEFQAALVDCPERSVKPQQNEQ